MKIPFIKMHLYCENSLLPQNGFSSLLSSLKKNHTPNTPEKNDGNISHGTQRSIHNIRAPRLTRLGEGAVLLQSADIRRGMSALTAVGNNPSELVLMFLIGK